jgi:hypothetical protein
VLSLLAANSRNVPRKFIFVRRFKDVCFETHIFFSCATKEVARVPFSPLLLQTCASCASLFSLLTSPSTASISSTMIPSTPTNGRRGAAEQHDRNAPHQQSNHKLNQEKLTFQNLRNVGYHLLKFLCLLYYYISLSFRLSFMNFSFTFSSLIGSMILDYLVDLLFILDYLSYQYQQSHGNLVVVPVDQIAESAEIVSIDFMRSSRRNSASSLGEFYIAKKTPFHLSRFIFEFISTCPLEVIGFLVGYSAYPWLRLNRLIRIFYGPSYWANIILSLEQCGFQMRSGWTRVVLSCIFQTVICHVAGCAYFTLAMMTMDQGHGKTWLTHDKSVAFDENDEVVFLRPKYHIYIRALYWSAQTLVTFLLAFTLPSHSLVLSVSVSLYLSLLTSQLACT